MEDRLGQKMEGIMIKLKIKMRNTELEPEALHSSQLAPISAKSNQLRNTIPTAKAIESSAVRYGMLLLMSPFAAPMPAAVAAAMM